jgi:MATE family, multidrug efflux pump
MKDNKQFLATEPVGKLLFKMSAPATVGMLVAALYNLVDTIFVGHGVGPLAIGAISIVFPIQAIVMAFAQTMGMGGASIISRALGRGDHQKAEDTLGNIVVIIVIFAAFISITGSIFLSPMLRVFGATENILPYAVEYLRITLFGYFFFTITMALNNIIRAEGKAKASMVVMIAGAGLNIILDPIFIFGFNMGISGAAIATVISQIFSFSLLLGIYFGGYTTLKISINKLKLSWSVLSEVFAIGAAIFVRQMAGSLMTILINNSLKHYGGDLYITIFGIFHRLLMFLFMPLFGLMQGLQPIVGFNYGAKKPKRVKKAIKLAIFYATAIATVGSLILFVFPSQLISMFTSEPMIISEGARIIRISVIALPLVGFNIVGTVMFLALGKALPSLLLSMTRQIFFFIPLMLVLPIWFNVTGIWMAFPISDILSFLVILVMVLLQFKILTNKTSI